LGERARVGLQSERERESPADSMLNAEPDMRLQPELKKESGAQPRCHTELGL